ncbi:lipid IV(A) 3-deoxy-D-manno-octulosonic acid transferase [Pontibacterium sp.]|uniref:lipid IV(A) 3-deoxy-D-manno-octulosonic acid transferase n=1 Tax=Pontibacterium sp. TaxID=2036026 RepID=UPI003510EBAC
MPLVLLRLWWRGRKQPAYRERWWQRLGCVPEQSGPQPIWIHAVSVGETLAIVPLVKLLLQRHPDIPIIMTTMTPTGAERVRAAFGNDVQHFYCPYDVPWAVNRFLKRIDPRVCMVVETELWPNLINCCDGHKVPSLLVNARLSERSARGYRRFSGVTRPMLQQLSYVVAQDQPGADRFVALGLPEDNLFVNGSIKFDVAVPQGLEEESRHLRHQWGECRPVLIAASTHDPEEEQLLQVFRLLLQTCEDLVLVIVPRHPDRFDEVAAVIEAADFEYCRRSSGTEPTSATQVYLGDTMGELVLLYAASDIAVVGGSLIERGGHNPLEPAFLGKPVIMGPHVFNFEEICERLQKRGGLSIVQDKDAMAATIKKLLEEEQCRRDMGQKGRTFVEENKGALERLYKTVDRWL